MTDITNERLAEAEKDAERYRWLRNCPGSEFPTAARPIQDARGYRLSDVDLDKFIDSALRTVSASNKGDTP